MTGKAARRPAKYRISGRFRPFLTKLRASADGVMRFKLKQQEIYNAPDDSPMEVAASRGNKGQRQCQGQQVLAERLRAE